MNTQSPLVSQRVSGKVVLIAGAASGIGRAAALLLAQHGAVVNCADLDAVGAAATAESAAKGEGLRMRYIWT